MSDAPNTMIQERVSFLVRTIDGRFQKLERAIACIYANNYPNIEVVVYQGEDLQFKEQLSDLIGRYPELTFKMVLNPANQKSRAKHLNLGRQHASGRYLCFLDDEDMIYPNHVESLLTALQQSGKVWAYSQVHVLFVEEQTDYIQFRSQPFHHTVFDHEQFWEAQTIPLVSVMVDTKAIADPAKLLVDEDLELFEDDALLLALSQVSEPALCSDTTCAYVVPASHWSGEFPKTLSSKLELVKRRYPHHWPTQWERLQAYKDRLIKTPHLTS